MNLLLPALIDYTVGCDTCWSYMFPCDQAQRLPAIDILFGDYWLEIQVDDYVVELGDLRTCSFCISSLGWDESILGTALMRDYYSVHDMTNQRFGFAPLTGAKLMKRAPSAGTTPAISFTSYTGTGLSEWYGAKASDELCAAFGLSGLLVVIVGIYAVNSIFTV